MSLLAPHLTDENVETVLEAARHQSKRDVERLVVATHPQPDIPSSIRALSAAPAAIVESNRPSALPVDEVLGAPAALRASV